MIKEKLQIEQIKKNSEEIFGMPLEKDISGNPYLTIDTITGSVGDYVVKQTVSDGSSKTESLSIWFEVYYQEFFLN